VDKLVLTRDMVVMSALTISLFIIGYGFRKGRKGRVNRFEGAGLIVVYIAYTIILLTGSAT
ncbi:MAG: calcium/sodium antiporter, partial [Spirochaetia bacterium]|nr:calcium/sodium antiporter [Spirochaetia bacterium]